MTDLGRFLVVRLERDLHPSRVVGISLIFKTTPGVISVTDLAGISQETLDTILLVPDPEPRPAAAPVQDGLFEGVA